MGIRNWIAGVMPVLAAMLVFAGFVAGAQAQDRVLGVTHTAAAATDKKVALVIGNAAYADGALRNPVNDARAVSAKLQKLGFDVIRHENVTARNYGGVLRDFRNRLTPGAVALFFYAGHGLQVGGKNYFPAVDAQIVGEDDIPMQSLELNQVLGLMEQSKTRMNLVFLDACRNNPYTRSFRSAAGGLARVEAPSGTLISYATRPGSVAADGAGANGLYTSVLLKNLETPGLPVELLLKRVVGGVADASRGAQEPWMEGSIRGDFYFVPGSGGNSSAVVSVPEPVYVPAVVSTPVAPTAAVQQSVPATYPAESRCGGIERKLHGLCESSSSGYDNCRADALSRIRKTKPEVLAECPELAGDQYTTSAGGPLASVSAASGLNQSSSQACGALIRKLNLCEKFREKMPGQDGQLMWQGCRQEAVAEVANVAQTCPAEYGQLTTEDLVHARSPSVEQNRRCAEPSYLINWCKSSYTRKKDLTECLGAVVAKRPTIVSECPQYGLSGLIY